MESLTNLINRIGLPRLAAMGTVAVLILGFFGFLVLRAQTPNLAPLYSGLSLEDSSAIVTELQTLNIPFELRGEGDTILVPRDQITTLRMNLAGEGLPSRGQVGYEIFDQQSTLGATSFVQNINNVRALEGELARTISSLARIKSARVHLVLPERELFRRERKDPSASIVLSVRGSLSTGEIRAIQHMVATAIQGLNPQRVSIVDDAGNLLASGAEDNALGALSGQAEERTLGFENRIRTRVEDMLANVVGAGRARVEVSAELDFNRSTVTAETFDPEGQVVRSTQVREAANQSGTASGQVSVANELPGASDAAGEGQGERGNSTEEVVNYEISKKTETAVTEAGSLKRLSVAVVVDGAYTDDGAGNVTYTPRSADELAQILTLVRSAVGYSVDRGDSVEVVNMQFAERPELATPGTDSNGGLLDFTRDDLMNGAEMAVTLLIALALLFFVLRPLLRKVMSPEPEPLALPAAVELGQNGTLDADGQVIPVAEQIEHGGAPSTIDWVSDAKAVGEQQMQALKSVGELIDENPKQAALVVRNWLNSAA
ncbi:flagellar basal-body MS-ring/collar protein FliF [Devosia sp. FJ2-5-3]|uniref:flagellar basal-body MS-ring/collar protein FliF n=1 Tax=Devosia sp. FJ2-5-3 TaxID=2976680 RepID=UPI0023D82E8A|nr:flagellar basal-body MS-ring/collar protein FliF [Devosia sp. FJ2-5-3]WEJ57959.1 flagellar basal-body MS-ring/collar protein FliF [Devosia sp. FJ2-5-3]